MKARPDSEITEIPFIQQICRSLSAAERQDAEERISRYVGLVTARTERFDKNRELLVLDREAEPSHESNL